MFSKPLARKPVSPNPEDSFLEIVLHQNFKGEYCTHLLNNQTNGFVHGHYFGKDQQGLQNALKDFNERGVETKLNEVGGNLIDAEALVETIRLLTFALETAVNLGAARLGSVAHEELSKYVLLGKNTLSNRGIDS